MHIVWTSQMQLNEILQDIFYQPFDDIYWKRSIREAIFSDAFCWKQKIRKGKEIRILKSRVLMIKKKKKKQKQSRKYIFSASLIHGRMAKATEEEDWY